MRGICLGTGGVPQVERDPQVEQTDQVVQSPQRFQWQNPFHCDLSDYPFATRINRSGADEA
jgi:hypothetical protein